MKCQQTFFAAVNNHYLSTVLYSHIQMKGMKKENAWNEMMRGLIQQWMQCMYAMLCIINYTISFDLINYEKKGKGGKGTI